MGYAYTIPGGGGIMMNGAIGCDGAPLGALGS